MGGRRFDTIYDVIEHGAKLRVGCSHCGNHNIFDAKSTLRIIEAKRPLPDGKLSTVGKRFRCRQCGKKGAALSPALYPPI